SGFFAGGDEKGVLPEESPCAAAPFLISFGQMTRSGFFARVVCPKLFFTCSNHRSRFMKIQFATKTLAASLIALSLGLTGCLTDSKDDDKEPEVTTPWTADSALTVGAQGHLTLGTAV